MSTKETAVITPDGEVMVGDEEAIDAEIESTDDDSTEETE